MLSSIIINVKLDTDSTTWKYVTNLKQIISGKTVVIRESVSKRKTIKYVKIYEFFRTNNFIEKNVFQQNSTNQCLSSLSWTRCLTLHLWFEKRQMNDKWHCSTNRRHVHFFSDQNLVSYTLWYYSPSHDYDSLGTILLYVFFNKSLPPEAIQKIQNSSTDFFVYNSSM